MEALLGLVNTTQARIGTSGIIVMFSFVDKLHWTMRIVTESDWFRKDRTMSELNRK